MQGLSLDKSVKVAEVIKKCQEKFSFAYQLWGE